jgi:uncharacterized Zn finger protein
MSQIIDKLALWFPSTERRKGASAAEGRAVQVSSSSDTLVSAFVRNSTPARVTLSTSQVTDGLITAKCTCTVAKKSQLCRHIWATLLKLDDQSHDFLLSKESISLADTDDLRKQRGDRKDRAPAFHYPSDVEQARQYFQANGFEMKQPFELSEIVDAKKQLSRVFHPDKGGSHDEILELNRNFQILSDYLKS